MTAIYFDNAATTPLVEEVRAGMLPFLTESWGNPSSLHRRGIYAREAIDRARAQIARAVGAKPEFVRFTSGGTEANNLAILGLVRGSVKRTGSIWIGPTEHASVRACADALEQEGIEVRRGKLDARGKLDLEQLAESLDESTLLVSQMLVSNEFGSVYPAARVAALTRARAPKAFVHIDAIQALGKWPVSLSELGADSLSLSAHKIHGPQGAGALVLARATALRPMLLGGGQEGGLRSGTENLSGIVGFGLAAEFASKSVMTTLAHLRELRTRFLAGIAHLPGITCLAPGAEREQQPGIISLVVPGAPAEVWLHHLDARGVVVSVGSACQANKNEISPVLLAAGLSASEARQVLRLSFSAQTTLAEIERGLQILGEVRSELARM